MLVDTFYVSLPCWVVALHGYKCEFSVFILKDFCSLICILHTWPLSSKCEMTVPLPKGQIARCLPNLFFSSQVLGPREQYPKVLHFGMLRALKERTAKVLDFFLLLLCPQREVQQSTNLWSTLICLKIKTSKGKSTVIYPFPENLINQEKLTGSQETRQKVSITAYHRR